MEQAAGERRHDERDVEMILSYIDKLQKANADDLAFYPLATLEKAIDAGQVLLAYENGEPCGYLWFGAVRMGMPVTIYQACIDYEARRRTHGHAVVARLVTMAQARGAVSIRLKCASSADSNAFWQEIGFTCTRVTQGGVKRGRQLNHWYSPISAALWTPLAVEPSTLPIDLRPYQAMKRAGVEMQSRFSRTHYGAKGADDA